MPVGDLRYAVALTVPYNGQKHDLTHANVVAIFDKREDAEAYHKERCPLAGQVVDVKLTWVLG